MWYDAKRTLSYRWEAGRCCYGSYGEEALLVGEADVYRYCRASNAACHSRASVCASASVVLTCTAR